MFVSGGRGKSWVEEGVGIIGFSFSEVVLGGLNNELFWTANMCWWFQVVLDGAFKVSMKVFSDFWS